MDIDKLKQIRQNFTDADAQPGEVTVFICPYCGQMHPQVAACDEVIGAFRGYDNPPDNRRDADGASPDADRSSVFLPERTPD